MLAIYRNELTQALTLATEINPNLRLLRLIFHSLTNYLSIQVFMGFWGFVVLGFWASWSLR